MIYPKCYQSHKKIYNIFLKFNHITFRLPKLKEIGEISIAKIYDEKMPLMR